MTEKTPLERFDEYVKACKTVRVLQATLDALDAAAEDKLAATEAHIRGNLSRTLEAAKNRVAILVEDVRNLTVTDLYPNPLGEKEEPESLPLDPHPFACATQGEPGHKEHADLRWSARVPGSSFQPRERYEQDRSKYE